MKYKNLILFFVILLSAFSLGSCNNQDSQSAQASNKCEHVYDGITIITASTCEFPGTALLTCTICDHYEYQEIPISDQHIIEIIPGKEATCDSTGLSDGEKCSVCNTFIKKQEVIPKLECVESEWIYDDSTCTEQGVRRKVCTICEKLLMSEPIAAKGHTLVSIPGKPSTCSSTGLTDGKKCTVCNTIVEPQTIVAKKNHSVVKIPATPASCVQVGYTEGSYCSVCNITIVAQQKIPQTAHTIVRHEKIDSTCTQVGITSFTTCSVCKRRIEQPTEIPAKGHKFGSSGYCSVCGEKAPVKNITAEEATLVINAMNTGMRACVNANDCLFAFLETPIDRYMELYCEFMFAAHEAYSQAYMIIADNADTQSVAQYLYSILEIIAVVLSGELGTPETYATNLELILNYHESILTRLEVIFLK